jgi:HK97 family phage major capsid protein
MPTAPTPVELRRQGAARFEEAKAYLESVTIDGANPSAEEAERFRSLMAESNTFAAQADEADEQAARTKTMWEEVDRRKKALAASTGRQTAMMPHEDPGNTRKGTHRYSMLKAMREACLGHTGHALTGLEKEVHDEFSKRRRDEGLQPAKGIVVPNSLPVDLRDTRRWMESSGMRPSGGALERYDLDTTAGAGSIPTILDTDMIDILRARMVTVAMGARVMEGMQGLFAIPRQNQAATFNWVTQGIPVTKSNQTIDQVPFAPHTGGVQTLYTRQFLEQTNQSAEAFVRYDQAQQTARGVEAAGLAGPGTGGAPKGLISNTLIPVVAVGTNGGAPTWQVVVGLETSVGKLNADMGSLGYVTDAAVRGTLKQSVKVPASTFPIYLWETTMPEFPVNGYRTGITNLLPNNLTHGTGTNLHAMIFGNWNDLIYAFWSGLDVIVDPYTAAGAGSVVVTTLQDVDVNVRHPESFAICADVAPLP